MWIPRGAWVTQGILTAFWHPTQEGLWQWCSDPGAVPTVKIKRFTPPGVGNRRDSDTKGANEGGDFDRRNCQISYTPGSASGGGDPGDSHWLVHKI